MRCKTLLWIITAVSWWVALNGLSELLQVGLLGMADMISCNNLSYRNFSRSIFQSANNYDDLCVAEMES